MPMEIIRSRDNPLVRRFRLLRAGRDQSSCLLEGFTLIEEALASAVVIEDVAITRRALEDERGQALWNRLSAAGARPRLVDEAVLRVVSELETSQGVVARARRPSFPEESLFMRVPLILVAVDVQNPGNLGALMRTGEAAGATGLYCTPGGADPFSWKALRGAMGSAFRLPHVRKEVPLVIDTLRLRSIRVVVTTPRAARSHDAFDWSEPVALVVGNEGAGLPSSFLEAADTDLRIPMHGKVESLNVAAAAAVILFEAARQRRSISR